METRLRAGYLPAVWKAVHQPLKSLFETLKHRNLEVHVLKAAQLWNTSKIKVHVSTLKGLCKYF